MGRKTRTAKILKKSCTVAAAKARLNSMSCLTCPSEAKVFVTVVPKFAPMIIGTASPVLTTPAATSPTITDVDTEED